MTSSDGVPQPGAVLVASWTPGVVFLVRAVLAVGRVAFSPHDASVIRLGEERLPLLDAHTLSVAVEAVALAAAVRVGPRHELGRTPTRFLLGFPDCVAVLMFSVFAAEFLFIRKAGVVEDGRVGTEGRLD